VKAFYESGFGEFREVAVPTLEMMRRCARPAAGMGCRCFSTPTPATLYRFATSVEADAVVHGLWN
jgi:hypothetical protein